MATRRAAAPAGALTGRQRDILAELERLAKRLGLKISGGRLLFSGLKLKGGRCSLRQQPWLVIDRLLSYEEQVEAFKKAFMEVTPRTGIPEAMVRNLSKEVRDLAALTVRAIGGGVGAPRHEPDWDFDDSSVDLSAMDDPLVDVEAMGGGSVEQDLDGPELDLLGLDDLEPGYLEPSGPGSA